MILVRKASEVRKRREIKFLNHNRPGLCSAIDWVCSNAVVSPEASSSNSTLIFIIFYGEVDSGAADYKFGKFWDEEEWEALLLSKGTLKWSDIVLSGCSRGKFMFKQLLSKNTRNFESFCGMPNEARKSFLFFLRLPCRSSVRPVCWTQ